MFAFISPGSNIDDKTGLYSMVICQKTDSKYAYFYPDYHFIVANKKEDISDEEIAELKRINDWGQNIDETKMTKVKIQRKKNQGNYGGTSNSKIFRDEVDFENETLSFYTLGVDVDNRCLYYVRVFDNSHNYKRSYIILLNDDYSYEDSYLQELKDIWNYQDQLKEFKKINNWELYVE
jgi:hypothetical protein